MKSNERQPGLIQTIRCSSSTGPLKRMSRISKSRNLSYNTLDPIKKSILFICEPSVRFSHIMTFIVNRNPRRGQDWSPGNIYTLLRRASPTDTQPAWFAKGDILPYPFSLAQLVLNPERLSGVVPWFCREDVICNPSYRWTLLRRARHVHDIVG